MSMAYGLYTNNSKQLPKILKLIFIVTTDIIIEITYTVDNQYGTEVSLTITAQ